VWPINPYQKTPALSAVKTHAYTIRSLTIHSNDCLQFLSAGYRHLQVIRIKEISSWGVPDSKALQDEFHGLLLRIVCENPALNTICLAACDISTTADFWKACVERLDQLHHVSLDQVAMDNNVHPWCWAALARSTKMTITLSQWALSKQSIASDIASSGQHLASPPITQQIEFRQLRNISVQQQWQLIAGCPEATEITWQPCLLDAQRIDEASTLNLKPIITPGVWPRLQRLDLAKSMLSDESFSVLLENLNPLLHLDARVTCFGKLAMRSLLCWHITVLEHLNLSGCEELRSSDIQGILTSGVQLKVFKATRLKVKEIDAPYYSPWVCTRITHLTLFFDIRSQDQRAANELVFRQLGRLSCLEILKLSLPQSLVRWTTVSLRLDMGLALLAGLKHLREIRIINIHQDLRVEDAEWMAKHWSLTRMEGPLHSNPQKHYALLKLIMRR